MEQGGERGGSRGRSWRPYLLLVRVTLGQAHWARLTTPTSGAGSPAGGVNWAVRRDLFGRLLGNIMSQLRHVMFIKNTPTCVGDKLFWWNRGIRNIVFL